jgi:trk system potassium uptake protein TrkH
MVNINAILQITGVLLVTIGGLMLFPWAYSFYHQLPGSVSLLISSGITVGFGLMLWLVTRKKNNQVQKREGYLIVTVGWLSMLVFSMLPYLFSGVIPSIPDAFFETVSGMTTTGATVLEDIEAVPKSILLWRSMTQWIGGMGIIVLTIAILPFLGVGGIELFVAEAPGPVSDKIHPRIRATARALWIIYVSLTLILCLALNFLGMNFFDAINHAMTTMATGGFSTKNDIIDHFQAPAIQYVIMLFMFLAGTNYTVIYFLVRFRLRKVWSSEEFRSYLLIVAGLIVIASFIVNEISTNPFERNFREAAFQVISIITTTGYVTADYTGWTTSLTAFFFVLMFAGASAGSTAGGIKLIRHLVFFKNSILEFKRLLHPKAMIRLKLNKRIIPARILTHILVFLLIYMGVFVIGTIIVTALGMDLLSAAGAVATSLGNVGPGIGSVGPMANFAHLTVPIKWVLISVMLLGRLELFTILILFTPYFWKTS